MQIFSAALETLAQGSAYQAGRLVGQIVGVLLVIAIILAVFKKIRGE